MDAKQILKKAKRFLETDGWCRGASTDDRGRHCATGALGCATNEIGSPDHTQARELLLNAIMERHSNEYAVSGIVAWNDEIVRDKRDVLRMFDRAIKAAA